MKISVRSTLECGGSTPPWNNTEEEEEEGGVEPPHSKVLRTDASTMADRPGSALTYCPILIV